MWNSGKMQRKRSSPSRSALSSLRISTSRIERAGRRQIRVGQHRAFGRAGRAAGIGEHGHRIRRIVDGMGLKRPSLSMSSRKAMWRASRLTSDSMPAEVMCALTASGAIANLGELADYHRLQPRGLEELLGLRIESRRGSTVTRMSVSLSLTLNSSA